MITINPNYQEILKVTKISDSFFDTSSSLITQLVFGPDQRLYAVTYGNGVYSFAYDPSNGSLTDKRLATSISVTGIAFHQNAMYLSIGYSGATSKILRLRDENANGLWGPVLLQYTILIYH